jgi:hypothetical protein
MLKKGSGFVQRTDNRGVGRAQFDQGLDYILSNREMLVRNPAAVRNLHFTKGTGGSKVSQYTETNLINLLFNLLRIKGLYMLGALLAHPQEPLQPCHSQLT